MSVLVFLDQGEGHIRKSAYEAAAYGAKIAEQLGIEANGVVLGKVEEDLASLGKYGLKHIYHADDEKLNQLDDEIYTAVIAGVVGKTNGKVIVFSNNFNGKSIAPRLSVRLQAGLVSGAVALPETADGFVVKKSVFSGKALQMLKLKQM